MPIVAVTMRCLIDISGARRRLLYAGDVSEFDMMTQHLKDKLHAENVIIDDINDSLPLVLRMRRDDV